MTQSSEGLLEAASRVHSLLISTADDQPYELSRQLVRDSRHPRGARPGRCAVDQPSHKQADSGTGTGITRAPEQPPDGVGVVTGSSLSGADQCGIWDCGIELLAV